jgi:hypothetical protein
MDTGTFNLQLKQVHLFVGDNNVSVASSIIWKSLAAV